MSEADGLVVETISEVVFDLIVCAELVLCSVRKNAVTFTPNDVGKWKNVDGFDHSSCDFDCFLSENLDDIVGNFVPVFIEEDDTEAFFV